MFKVHERLRAGSLLHLRRVLDPFVGSAGILLPAAYLLGGRGRMFGCDADEELINRVQRDVQTDFAEHGLPPPVLIPANILHHPHTTWPDDDGVFEAIICDPPYGKRAAFVIGPPKGFSNDGVLTTPAFIHATQLSKHPWSQLH